MAQIPVDPFWLAYDGLDADGHTADALYVGQSLQGTARVYNSIINMHFAGRVVSPAAQSIRIHVGPTQEGSLLYMIYMMMVHGKMAVYPEIFFELASFAVPHFLKAIIARRSGQTKLMEKMVDLIHDMHVRNSDFAKQVHADHVMEKSQILGIVERLAISNKKPLSDMAAPVGRTVRQIEHFKGTADPVIVDEPIAEALRSKEEAIVGELQQFAGTILAVDKITGAGKLLLDGETEPTKAKITDPVLSVPENVYTHALDTAARVVIDAKPVLKEGGISTLYISDARPEAKT